LETATAVASSPTVNSRFTETVPSTGLYAATIFLGAFLLFQVQLIIGKYVLPWFGGTIGVWAACLLFFQCLLLAGYSYAHWLSTRHDAARIHRVLIASSVLALIVASFFWRTPIMAGESWKPQDSAMPVFHILRLLTICVGLPFFLLSTTGPLIQRWFANNYPGASPYRLYALSNLGSLLGLLMYPLLVEPLFRLTVQGWLWCAGYALYAVGLLICSRHAAASEASTASPVAKFSDEEQGEAPGRKQFLMWLGLTACASIMLLAVTQTICQDLSAIPLLWVLPLSVYLISFIICFEHERWYKRFFFHCLLAAALVGVLIVQRGVGMRQWSIIAFYLLVLFACCMFCHGEVYRSRPTPRHLTTFYLSVAVGGALGGIFVNLIAPLIFRGYWELPLGLFACFAAMLWMALRDRHSWVYRNVFWLPLAIWGYWCAQYVIHFRSRGLIAYLGTWQAKLLLALAILASVTAALQLRSAGRESGAIISGKYSGNVPPLMKVCLVFVLLFAGGELAADKYRRSLWSDRNFYGVLYAWRLETRDPRFTSHVLTHGRVQHGLQVQAPELRREPTFYFGRDSGVGLMLLNHPRRKAQPPAPLRVGVIGLGIGTLAAYGEPGDVFRFYEINPAVIDVATKTPYFSFVSDSPAKIELVEGDARISLERELKTGQSQKYDILVIDAFNSDSIPVHLLTKEAFQVYLRHLRGPDSVIAVHISNYMLQLAPVITGQAWNFQLYYAHIYSRPRTGSLSAPSQWMLLSANPKTLQQPAIMNVSTRPPERDIPLWTDEYSSVARLF
jgi:hypothetical protein